MLPTQSVKRSLCHNPKHPDVAVLEPGPVEELKLLFKLDFVLMATIAGFFTLLLFDYDAIGLPELCARMVDARPR